MLDERFRSILTRGFFVWLLIIVVETIHGLVRTLLLEPLVGDFTARQVSTFIGAVFILVITFIFVRWLKGNYAFQFVLIGIMWVALTVGFELLLGRFVMDLSWERISSDYNVANGGLMPFGLLVMTFAPLAMAEIVGEI